MTTPTPPTIYGVANVDVIGPGFTDDPGDPRTGKPYVRLVFLQGPTVYLTGALADMIGGVGRGAMARWGDLQMEKSTVWGSER